MECLPLDSSPGPRRAKKKVRKTGRLEDKQNPNFRIFRFFGSFYYFKNDQNFKIQRPPPFIFPRILDSSRTASRKKVGKNGRMKKLKNLRHTRSNTAAAHIQEQQRHTFKNSSGTHSRAAAADTAAHQRHTLEHSNDRQSNRTAADTLREQRQTP